VNYWALLDWADALTEIGPDHTVGARMSGIIKEKLREAYRTGFKDGQKDKPKEHMRAPRNVSSRRIRK
jgi:hypothetical protein